jgi:exodeoxyribonuclease VII large subunit
MSFHPHTFRQTGEGDLRAQVAALADKLRAEGLMDDARKKPLPEYPRCVGVITSPNGAAIHDVLRTLNRRYPIAQVSFFGTLVEGHEAEKGLAHAITVADSHKPDVILLVRGGGSFEDLLPFSTETVARTIAQATTPIVTGIGHEPDYSIADMVADFRASTPTAAAEAVVPAREELYALLDGYTQRLDIPFEEYLMRVDSLQQRLESAIPGRLERDRMALTGLLQRFIGVGGRITESQTNRLLRATAQLDALSPLKVLARGYAAAFDPATGTVIDSIHQVTAGDPMTVKVSDGSIDAIVQDIREGVVG